MDLNRLPTGRDPKGERNHATDQIREKAMMTVREKLMSEALTDTSRELLGIWFEEQSDPYCARQRAWEAIARRNRGGMPDIRVR